MKVLVLCGDRWHAPDVVRAGLGALTGFTFEYIEDGRDWSPEVMAAYACVVLAKSNHVSAGDQGEWMTDQAQAAFAAYVSSGNGLLAVHAGTAEYEHKPVLRGLLGGVFMHHPEGCPVTVTPQPAKRPDEGAHPLCSEVAPFTIHDEHYFMALDDPDADVFITTASEHGEQPGGWRRTVGSGRVAILTPGHNAEVWLHPSYRTLLGNVLRWCMGG